MEMAEDTTITPYTAVARRRSKFFPVERARILGGVIVEVCELEQARIAEQAGARAVLIFEPIHKGILQRPVSLRFNDIKRALTIPVFVKVRVGHFVEAQILDFVGVRHFDESDEESVAVDENFINKHAFNQSHFICGCQNLGEALRRVKEGAAMVKTRGDVPCSNNIAMTLHNVTSVMEEIRKLRDVNDEELFDFSKKIQAPYDLVKETKELRRLPAVHFADGAIMTPADVALMMHLGCDGVIVGLDIFDYPNPLDRLRGMIQAAEEFQRSRRFGAS